MPNTTKQPVNETAEETSGKLVDRLVDQPTTDDLLGFEDFATSVAENINNKNTKITMGIYGEWGSGKTSFLQMIEKHLKEKDIKPIWFKAWQYDKEDHLWRALLKTILDQTKQREQLMPRVKVELRNLLANSGLRAAVKKVGSILIRSVVFAIGIVILLGLYSGQIADFLKTNNALVPASFQSVIVKVVGVIAAVGAASPLLNSLFGSLKESLNTKVAKTEDKPSYREPAFFDEFKTFRKDIDRLKPREPLVVIIDDLDRCSPEKTIQVLEVIVAFQDSKDFVFLLALDRKMIEVSIAAKYKEMMTLDHDQNGLLRKKILFYECYMEKIFQQSIFLPLLSKFTIENYVANLSCDEDIKQCASIFAAGIPPNPRKIKCILRAFLFIRDVVKGDAEIKPSLLAKLIVIKYQFPDVFEAIAERPSLLEELEKYFRNKQAGDEPLSKQVEQYVADYPELGRMLIEGGDTFIEAKLCRYIALTCAAG